MARSVLNYDLGLPNNSLCKVKVRLSSGAKMCSSNPPNARAIRANLGYVRPEKQTVEAHPNTAVVVAKGGISHGFLTD